MILTRVDLPAPFSPSRAWITPGRSERGDLVVGGEVAEALHDADRFQEVAGGGRLFAHRPLRVRRPGSNAAPLCIPSTSVSRSGPRLEGIMPIGQRAINLASCICTGSWRSRCGAARADSSAPVSPSLRSGVQAPQARVQIRHQVVRILESDVQAHQEGRLLPGHHVTGQRRRMQRNQALVACPRRSRCEKSPRPSTMRANRHLVRGVEHDTEERLAAPPKSRRQRAWPAFGGQGRVRAPAALRGCSASQAASASAERAWRRMRTERVRKPRRAR